MEISKRLKAIADMVTRSNTACDVGTDHGYLAIYLVNNNICPGVIAMDVAGGPLGKAVDNIKAYNLGDRISTRLSDGVDKLSPGEAQTVIMAGMGGRLINSLLEKGSGVLSTVDELILSPHTDADLVRHFLLSHGYSITNENMLVDEGKYYIIIRAVHGVEEYAGECEYLFGKLLLEDRNPLLYEYLKKELALAGSIYEHIEKVDTESARGRRNELQKRIKCIQEGLSYYEM